MKFEVGNANLFGNRRDPSFGRPRDFAIDARGILVLRSFSPLFRDSIRRGSLFIGGGEGKSGCWRLLQLPGASGDFGHVLDVRSDS